MSSKQLVFTVPDECDGMTARVFLRRRCGVSARILTQLKREKDGILRNGQLLKTIDILRSGDLIVLNLPEDKSEIVPVKGELDILYEDENILAVNKPAFMPVHPTKMHQLDTLANIVSYRQNKTGESFVFRAVNRLDRNTSGIILIAKDKFTSTALSNSVEKTYFAVCEGELEKSGTIDVPIMLSPDSKIKRIVDKNGSPAVTHFEPVFSNGTHTLIKLRLETGRTHQIRCHMSYIGYPLAGDDLYGGSLDLINRQALHCGYTSFIHPITEERIEIKSPIPKDFVSAFPWIDEVV